MRRLLLSVFIASCIPVQAQHATAGSTAATREGRTVSQARLLLARGKPADADALLETYLTTHEADADALSLLAQIKLNAGDDDAAERLLIRALNANANLPAANLLAGHMLATAQQFPQAMDRFETVLASEPHDKEARQAELDAATKLAAQAEAAGSSDVALTVFEHVRTKMPDDPELLLSVGTLAFNLHRLPEAEEAMTAARKLRPKDPDIVYALARVEIEEQHLPVAEAHLRSYLDVRPSDASAHFGLGRIYAMEQRDADARAEFEHSIQLQPIQTESYYQLGQLDLNAGDDKAAEPLFQRVIARDPKHGGALAGLGEIYFHQKQYSQAEGYLQRAVNAAPDYAPARYYYGLVLARLNRKTEAEEQLRLATKLGHDAAAPVSAPSPATQP